MIERTTVQVATDEATGKRFLQGTEFADKNVANVFSRSGPLLGLRPIGIEAEVKHCFFAVADDNFDDYAEVYMFRLWGWDMVRGVAKPRVILEWQEFTTDYFPGEGSWDDLLREATRRISDARYNRREFEPKMVEAPKQQHKSNR